MSKSYDNEVGVVDLVEEDLRVYVDVGGIVTKTTSGNFPLLSSGVIYSGGFECFDQDGDVVLVTIDAGADKQILIAKKQVDLFQEYKGQPDQLAAVCGKYLNILEDEDPGETNMYGVCEQFLREVRELGYTFNYYRDWQPYALRKMHKKDILE
jgi:hypothetical protein